MYIPSSEKGHELRPHVHVQNGKYRRHDPKSNTVRFNLYDLTVMDGAKKKVSRLFTKEEWNLVKIVLTEKQQLFIENYNRMLKGTVPETINIDIADRRGMNSMVINLYSRIAIMTKSSVSYMLTKMFVMHILLVTEPTTHKAATYCGPRWDFFFGE